MYLRFDNQTQQKISIFKKVIPWPVFIGLVFLASFFVIWLVDESARETRNVRPALYSPRPTKNEAIPEPVKKVFIPGPFSMETVKTRGCVGDGILSGDKGEAKKTVALFERSRCLYIHRALDTWMDDPDLEKAGEVMASFEKSGMVFGMFLSEAINKTDEYEDKETGEKFDFLKMCEPNTDDTWGFHSCVASFDREEYREYVKYITKKSMDIGIQSFLFGQIHYQDQQPLSESKLPSVIKSMRDYAKKKNLQIIIGAQTNSIADEKYLKLFDYIEGGVGMDSQGNIESGPCWSQKGSCWALLWHDRYRAKANNVLLHLDWSGIEIDDMSKFARMDKETRARTLESLYKYFTSRNMGFLMPFQAPIYPENGGCYGPKKRFYSADNRYKCKDEDTINAILSRGK